MSKRRTNKEQAISTGSDGKKASERERDRDTHSVYARGRVEKQTTIRIYTRGKKIKHKDLKHYAMHVIRME